MNKHLLLFVISLVLFVSCSKQPADGTSVTTLAIPEDPGCISRIYNDMPFKETIGLTDSLRCVQLLLNNNIALNNLVIRYVRYQDLDSFRLTTVNTVQFVNGVLLTGSDCDYVFNHDRLMEIRGTGIAATSLDTLPVLKLGQLRTLYLNNVHDVGFERVFTDSCFVAQFGYYNLNMGSPVLNPARLTKAWQVHTSGSFYPVAYIGDDGNIYRIELGYAFLKQ